MSAAQSASTGTHPDLATPTPKSASVTCVVAAVRAMAVRLAQGFAVDLRSLAVFRMGLALVVLADVSVALTNAAVFYSDMGVLPRTLLYERHWPSVTSWSLHAWSGGLEWQVLLLTVELIAAVCLLAGWRTRLANFVCWVLVCSLETRNPVITNGADTMTRLLLFWSLFLPLGARWSLDGMRAKARTADCSHSLQSVAGVALLLQVAFVYWFSVLCKTHECWWGDGSALIQTLQLDLFARPFGVWLRGHAEFCRGLTYGWLWVEIIGPVLAFLPFWRNGARLAAVVLFVLFHAGIELCMDIGAFPFVMMVAWVAFLPGSVWEWFAAHGMHRRAGKVDLHSRGAAIRPFHSTLHSPPCLPRVPWVQNALCLVCLAFIFMWNLRGTDFTFWERVFPRSVNPVAFALRLDQHWSMFAPRPTSEDGWFVLRAGMSDGTECDLLRDGAPADFSKPALLSATFKDARWQKYLTNIWLENYQHNRPWFGDCMAREWNAMHGGLSQVVAWQLWFMLEPTLSDGSAGPVKPCLLFERESFGGGPVPASAEHLRASSP